MHHSSQGLFVGSDEPAGGAALQLQSLPYALSIRSVGRSSRAGAQGDARDRSRSRSAARGATATGAAVGATGTGSAAAAMAPAGEADYMEIE